MNRQYKHQVRDHSKTAKNKSENIYTMTLRIPPKYYKNIFRLTFENCIIFCQFFKITREYSIYEFGKRLIFSTHGLEILSLQNKDSSLIAQLKRYFI